MIGLSEICKIYKTSFSELARELGTTPQNINAWLKYDSESRSGRKIPDKWLKELSITFDLPEHLFMKELTPEEMMKIELQNTANIKYSGSPEDYEELQVLTEETEENMGLLLNGLDDLNYEEYEDFEYESKEDMINDIRTMVRYHTYTKNNLDFVQTSKQVGYNNKFYFNYFIFNVVLDLIRRMQEDETFELTSFKVTRIEQAIKRILDSDDPDESAD
ncbi:hypothetical protein ACP8HI_12515 [Paenibacillus sp. FA6]|uniref:hypothetical protein n=1 Tax=Paenibacillus sp. FA6 TaxID=3413029 RepID=UPI003F659E91